MLPPLLTSNLLTLQSFLITTGLIPRSLLRNGDSKSSQGPSFPHAFSGNPGEFRTGPPIKTFGGDNFGGKSSEGLLIPRSLLRGCSFGLAFDLLFGFERPFPVVEPCQDALFAQSVEFERDLSAISAANGFHKMGKVHRP